MIPTQPTGSTRGEDEAWQSFSDTITQITAGPLAEQARHFDEAIGVLNHSVAQLQVDVQGVGPALARQRRLAETTIDEVATLRQEVAALRHDLAAATTSLTDTSHLTARETRASRQLSLVVGLLAVILFGLAVVVDAVLQR